MNAFVAIFLTIVLTIMSEVTPFETMMVFGIVWMSLNVLDIRNELKKEMK